MTHPAACPPQPVGRWNWPTTFFSVFCLIPMAASNIFKYA